MSNRIRKRILTAGPVITFLYRFVRFYAGTFRFTVENEGAWMERVKDGKAVVLCCWHQQFFSAIRHFRKYSSYNPSLMISKSTDGELIAGIATRTGWDIVRGSSSKGGRQGLIDMVSKLRSTKVAAHIADGPRGPAGKVKAGVIRLAQLAKADIIPFYITADRAWFFKSWDRFMLPMPFARVTLRFGDVFPVPQTKVPEDFETLRLNIEGVMQKWIITP